MDLGYVRFSASLLDLFRCFHPHWAHFELWPSQLALHSRSVKNNRAQ